MFTFGIFSTHMPYVFMILFYAVYFLFASPAGSRLIEKVAPEAQPETPELVQNHDSSDDSAVPWDFTVELTSDEPFPLRLPPEEKLCNPPDPPDILKRFASLPWSRPPPVYS